MPSTGERFAQAFGGLGSSLAQDIPQHFMQKNEFAAENEYLKQLGLPEEITNIRNPEIRKMALETALEQKNQASKLAGEYEAGEENYNKIKNAFGQKFADIWRASPQGARTELTRAALEARGRGIDLDKLLGGIDEFSSSEQNNSDQQTSQFKEEPENKVFDELKNTLSAQDKELLPSEKITRGKERYDSGLKVYQEAGSKLRGMTRDKERFDILEGLDKSDKLPKGLARLNVDKEGNLRLPFLASSDAQRYVKTLNEFSAGAKDTFGSRVTNFDLAQYLKRYPTLLNTKEGRRQLLDQMKLVNKINSVYYKNLKKIYDKAGGVRNIDSDVAERFAEQLSEPKTNELSEKFKQIGEFSSKPSASEFKGKKIRDKDTGEIFQSDGENWLPAE